MSLSGNLDYMKKTVLKMNDKKKQLCIVTGVGPEKGTGAEIAKYFSKKTGKCTHGKMVLTCFKDC